ncbi:MAG: EamA family transporter [Clostridia bacterium]|nr:EamA family transporter [Clostridia bacterium]
MSNLLVAVLVLLYTFQSAFCNLYAKHYPGQKAHASPVYSVLYGFLVALGTLVFARFAVHPSPLTWGLGILNGAALVTYNTLLIKAAALGPFSVTMIFNLSGGILIPLFWSALHDGESLSPWQYAAIAVMLVSFVFLNLEEKKEGAERQKVSLAFILTVTLLGCVNGLYGTLMNTVERAFEGAENADMIIVTFGSSAVLALLLLILQAKGETPRAFRQTPRSALFALAASVSACAAINLLMHALSLINVAVLYTLNNGGVLIVSVLWSVLILREKLGRFKVIGLILAIAAVFALSIL